MGGGKDLRAARSSTIGTDSVEGYIAFSASGVKDCGVEEYGVEE